MNGRSIGTGDIAKSLPVDEPVLGRSRKYVPVLPSGTYLLSDRSCWTPDGLLGTCSSVRSCNPNVKLPLQNDVDSGISIARGTCRYAEPDGRQVRTRKSTCLKGNELMNNPAQFC